RNNNNLMNDTIFRYGMTRLRQMMWICGVWGLASCGTAVTTYYVAPTGADTAAGTKDHPFGSLAAAKRAVAEEKAGGSANRFDVVMLPGTYFLSEPLVFGPEESG